MLNSEIRVFCSFFVMVMSKELFLFYFCSRPDFSVYSWFWKDNVSSHTSVISVNIVVVVHIYKELIEGLLLTLEFVSSEVT